MVEISLLTNRLILLEGGLVGVHWISAGTIVDIHKSYCAIVRAVFRSSRRQTCGRQVKRKLIAQPST